LLQLLGDCELHLGEQGTLFETHRETLAELRKGGHTAAADSQPSEEPQQEDTKGKKKVAARPKKAPVPSQPALTTATGRQDVTAFFVKLFQECLGHYSSVVLHEVCYARRSAPMRKALNPNLKAVIQTALANPQHYFGVASEQEKAARKELQPDICVMFELYCECDKFIQIGHIYRLFGEILRGHQKQLPEVELRFDPFPCFFVNADRDGLCCDYRARFLTCLNELEFLGFIKMNPAKPEEFQRLSWD